VDEVVERAGLYCDGFSFESFENNIDFGQYDTAMISLKNDCSLGSIFTSDKNEKSYYEGWLHAQNQRHWLFKVSSGLNIYDNDDIHYEIFQDTPGSRDYLCRANRGHFSPFYAMELIFSPWLTIE
jgi:hypothetical protein